MSFASMILEREPDKPLNDGHLNIATGVNQGLAKCYPSILGDNNCYDLYENKLSNPMACVASYKSVGPMNFLE
jgi:hypothetical protein